MNVSYRSDVPLTEEPTPTASGEEQVQVPELTTAKQIALPFKVLISPMKTFSQLAQKPAAIGLISLSALVLLVTAVAQYASATRIILYINDQPTSLLATDFFSGWYVGVFTSTALNIFLYWAIFAIGLTLISRMFGGKDTSWRAMLVVFGYVSSVFIVLYAVRAAMYLALPPIDFNFLSMWPPNSDQINQTLQLVEDTWGPLYAYQLTNVFTFAALAWLVLLATIAVRALRGVGWGRAIAVAAISFTFTLFLFGIP